MNDYQMVAGLVGGAVALALYAWYGFALSRLFPKLGIAAWKGWVPFLNEAEILGAGGVPRWNIVFIFIPVVQLYGIYLKAIAAHRIGESFGKGAGYTVLGVFLAPLWATLLASARMPADGAYGSRVEGLMSQAPAPSRPLPADALGAAPATPPAAPAVYASAPPPPPSAPVPVAFPSLGSAEPEPPVFITVPPAPPRVEPAPRPEPERKPEPEPERGSVYTPWAQAPPRAPAAAPAPVTASPGEPDDDEVDRTIAVERRPAVPWRLVTDDGHVIPLRARRVLLGRKPSAPSNDVAVVAVPDSTKTLSKNHARLELSDEGTWTVVDLDSTNGVIIIDADGTETLLPRGGSAPVPERFMLGTVAMRVTSDDPEVTR